MSSLSLNAIQLCGPINVNSHLDVFEMILRSDETLVEYTRTWC